VVQPAALDLKVILRSRFLVVGRGDGEMGIEKRKSSTDLHLRTATEQSPLATAILGPDGRYLLVNAAWKALWALGEGNPPKDSSIFEDERLYAMGLTAYIEECRQHSAVTTPLLFREATPETGPRWLQAFIYPVRDETGALLEVGLVLEDFTERKALEDQLAHQAFHDSLTGLPNRVLFRDRLVHALSRAKRQAAQGEAGRVAVMYMDLDDFKRFNDSLGHAAGDRLLVGVAERVTGILRLGDTFARIAGDEFAMLLEDLEDVVQAAGVAARIKQDLSAPFEVDGHQAVVTSSIGVVVAAPGETGEDYAEELMRRADIAMYRSKREGKNRHEIFYSGMNDSLERLGLEEDLRRAIEHQELRVYYQPQILMSTGVTVGFEALVRWEHPERGLLAPSEFITLAEETGMIIALGQWVLAEACRQVRIFREQIPPDASLRMSVNLSARQFRHPELVEEVSVILSETGTDSRDVVLEITESVMMEKGPNARHILRALKGLGLTLAMDDFGTGYSSITTLKSLPVDILKVDRSMVEGMDRDPQDRALVSATIGLAHALSLDVVVEGVETAGELDELRSMGCDIAQGYYWFGPCPSEKATELLVS
jgi:diguanylate cyclase (GGDEF)-like protein